MKKLFLIIFVVFAGLFVLFKYGNLPINPVASNVQSTQAAVSQVPQTPVETQANGLPAGAVREGNALIEGIRLSDKGVIVNNTFSEGVGKITSFYKANPKVSELHILTAYYSTTLGENVIIDANIKDGTRLFYKENGTSFYREGKGFKDTPAEQSLQTYVAMKGLANAIDGK